MMMNAYFVALELPDNIRQDLTSLTGDLAGVHWLATEQCHITLSYLGPIGTDMIDDLVASLGRVKHKPMRLSLGSVRLHPPSGEPRAIVTEVLKSEALEGLRKKINRAAMESGLERRRQRFDPHVTLGRFAERGRLMSRPETLGDYLVARAQYASDPFDIYSFSLYSSRRSSQGSEYELVSEFELI